MKTLVTLALVLAFALAGCHTIPTQLELTNADYGAAPVVNHTSVESWMLVRLKDPGSAQFAFAPATRGWARLNGDVVYGYAVPFSVNARNSFGAYTGAQLYTALFRNGRLHGINKVNDSGRLVGFLTNSELY